MCSDTVKGEKKKTNKTTHQYRDFSSSNQSSVQTDPEKNDALQSKMTIWKDISS